MGDRLRIRGNSRAFCLAGALSALTAGLAQYFGEQQHPSLHLGQIDVLAAHAQCEDHGNGAVERQVIAVLAAVGGRDPDDAKGSLDALPVDARGEDDIHVQTPLLEVERPRRERLIEFHSAAEALVASTDTNTRDARVLTGLEPHEDVHATCLEAQKALVIDVAEVRQEQAARRQDRLVQVRIVVLALG